MKSNSFIDDDLWKRDRSYGPVINYWELGGWGLQHEKIAGPKLYVTPPPPPETG